MGFDEKWLKKRLGKLDAEDVFLMTLDDDGAINIILKEENK